MDGLNHVVGHFNRAKSVRRLQQRHLTLFPPRETANDRASLAPTNPTENREPVDSISLTPRSDETLTASLEPESAVSRSQQGCAGAENTTEQKVLSFSQDVPSKRQRHLLGFFQNGTFNPEKI